MGRLENQNVLAGLQCPKCGGEGPFSIVGTACFVDVTDDGTDTYQDVEWTGTSTIICSLCDYMSDVDEFECKHCKICDGYIPHGDDGCDCQDQPITHGSSRVLLEGGDLRVDEKRYDLDAEVNAPPNKYDPGWEE